MNDANRTYSTKTQIKFKTTMIRSSLCDYSDGAMKGTITITGARADASERQDNEINKQDLKTVHDLVIA